MKTIGIREITEFLDQRDEARKWPTDDGSATFDELTSTLVPEMSLEDRVIIGKMAMSSFVSGLNDGMDVEALVVELFYRGIEFGRELELRLR